MIKARPAALAGMAFLAVAGALQAAPIQPAATHAQAERAVPPDGQAGAALILAQADGPSGRPRPSRLQAPGAALPRTGGAEAVAAAVPLPGALWLFGSALLAFLAIAGRRRF